MQRLYSITVTDAAYAHDGSSTFYITDEEVFKLFDAKDRISQIDPPEDFEEDGVFEWLFSLTEQVGEIVYPFICMGETHVWDNC